jgi:glycosyltransferase involved in cell wall biosynthesis
MKNKVSVVIPVYNEEKYIGPCLDSLEKQIEKPDEIIIVDDNCTDKTTSIVKKYKKSLPIKIVNEKKLGIVFARNKGFNEAKGDILARCDADSILSSNWIKKIKENFSKNKIDGLTGPIIFYDFFSKTSFFSKIYLLLMKILQNGETLMGPNMAISKNIWQKIKKEVCFNEKNIHEDIDLSLHILKNKGKIVYDWDLLVYSSARRITKTPWIFFINYPWRLIKNLFSHRF